MSIGTDQSTHENPNTERLMRDNPEIVSAIRELEKEKENIDKKIKDLRENAEVEMYKRVEKMQNKVERYLNNTQGIYFREDIRSTMIVIPFTVTKPNKTVSLHYFRLGWSLGATPKTPRTLNGIKYSPEAAIHDLPYFRIDPNTIPRIRYSIFRSQIKWKSRKPSLEMSIRMKICAELLSKNWETNLPKHHSETIRDLAVSVFIEPIEKQRMIENVASKFGI
jgi:hypothetical protein